MWKSGGNFIVKLWSHSTDLDLLIGGEFEEKEELKNYVMVDCKLLTYLKNKKQLILVVYKKFKIFDF